MYVLICDIYVFGYFWCDTIFKYDYKQKMLMGCYNIDGDQPKFSCVCIQYLKKKKTLKVSEFLFYSLPSPSRHMNKTFIWSCFCAKLMEIIILFVELVLS